MGNAKRKRQHGHARKRFGERFGISMDDSDLNLMVKKIHRGEAAIVEKQSNRVSKFAVDHNNTTYTVVYDRQRKSIVTVLPV